jgi:peptide/nickel transport system permease protein
MAYVIRRTIQTILLLWGVTIVAFLLIHLTPGDPAQLMLGEFASQEALDSMRQQMGLDQPLPVQYGTYMGNLLRGDLGRSTRAHRPVLPYVLERFPATVQLTIGALVVSLVVSLPIGIFAAVKRGTPFDNFAMFFALIGQATPGFWLGLMMIALFAVALGWLPAFGRGEGFSLKHMILPSFTLATFLMGLLVRLTRSSMLDVLSQDYIRTARAKGIRERGVLVRHALRNALIPLITVIGIQIGTLLGGAVVTEAVFAWPGVGSLVVQSISLRDYPVVQAIVLLLATVFVLINYSVDMVYHFLDPRIRVE